MPTHENNASDSKETSRRKFLKTTAAAASTAFSFTIVPRHVLGGQGQTPPSERINHGGNRLRRNGWSATSPCSQSWAQTLSLCGRRR